MAKIKVYPTLLLFLLISVAGNSLKAQYIDSLLSTLETKYVQEKVHLHLDKSYYNAGDAIWFKAYLVSDNLTNTISSTVYAELLDDKGTILQRKMMPVIQSGAASNFDLPDTLYTNRLYIRAYTSWMLNFDSTLLYLKPIQVVPTKQAPKKAPVPLTYQLLFFPEGGDLVENLTSRIGFKCTDNLGNPVEVKGDIMDSKGKKITSFSSVHDGMGQCLLQPLPGEKYKAVWKDKKNVAHETILPAAKPTGLVLSARVSDNEVNYSITRTENVTDAFTSFYVIAQMQQRLVYSARINMVKKTTVTAPIETDSLPNGILQLTIFNANRQPVAERVIFINHYNYYFITDLHSGEKSLKKRGLNTLQVDVGDQLLSNLSIAVTDADLNPVTKNEENIYSQLLLSSDLKGYVYNPAYYFSSDADSVKQHLDLVLMTNGWRRFKWEDVLAGRWPIITTMPESYLTIGGKIQGLSKNLLYQKEITAILKTKNGGTNIFNLPVDAQGQFKQSGLYFFDTAKLHYQLNNDKDKTLTSSASFAFLNNFIKAPLQPAVQLAGLYATERVDSSTVQKSATMASLRREQIESNKIKTLETVQLRSRQKTPAQKLDEEYTSGFFSGGDGYTFSTEDDPFAKSAMSIFAYLQGKVAGLQINTAGQGSATWRGSATSFFLNEMTADVGTLQTINMNDVALIKVFRPPFFGGAGGGAGGAIAIYTKKGGSDNSQVKGLPFTNIQGYSVIREFFSPDYEKNPEPDIKDYRSTLYWNPNLYFDKNTRRVILPFFNNDSGKKFRVIIEGINEAGKLTREEQIIE